MSLLIAGHAYGVDNCTVEASGKLSEVATKATIVEGTYGNQVCFTLIQGGIDFATPKGALADMPVGSEVPVATATLQRVKNAKTGHESYRAL